MNKASRWASQIRSIIHNGLFNETIGDNQPRTSTLVDGTRIITNSEGGKVTLPPAPANPENQISAQEKR